MTKQELEQLKGLKAEIKQLRDELQDLPITKDSVKGSMTEHPYIEVSIPIKGKDIRRETRLEVRLGMKLDELQDEAERMESWLDNLDDSEMRAILRLKYRNGMTDTEIGDKLGYSRSAVSMKLTRFFKND